jgi:predicted secreted protein
MSYNKARNFTLQIQSSISPSTYLSLGSLIDASLSILDEPDDVTSKGDAGARKLFGDGAIKAYDFSGNLVVTNEDGWTALRAHKASASRTCGFIVDDDVETYTGDFVIVTLNFTGGNAGAIRASLEIRSTGTIDVENS